MKDAPSSQAALPFSRSGSAEEPRPHASVASASASGGTMPAAITAAMILSEAVVVGGEARGGERVRRLVDRAAEVEAHHQAEDDAEQRRDRAGQAVEPVVRLVVIDGERPAEHEEHQDAGEQRGDRAG